MNCTVYRVKPIIMDGPNKTRWEALDGFKIRIHHTWQQQEMLIWGVLSHIKNLSAPASEARWMNQRGLEINVILTVNTTSWTIISTYGWTRSIDRILLIGMQSVCSGLKPYWTQKLFQLLLLFYSNILLKTRISINLKIK